MSSWFLVSDSELRRWFDDATLRRGFRYAEDGHVLAMELDDGELTISAMVRGSQGRDYETEVWIDGDPGPGRDVEAGCSCPVGIDCKHAAAVLYDLRRATAPPRPHVVPLSPSVPVRPTVPAWQVKLSAVLEAGRQAGPRRKLALQVDEPPTSARSAAYDDGASRLRLRPLVEGRKGAWIKTGASWRDVVTPYAVIDAVEGHREALAQVYATSTVARTTHYVTQEHLSVRDLGPIGWATLGRLAEAGVEIIDLKRRPVTIATQPITVTLDASRPDGATGPLVLRMTMTHDGRPLTPEQVRLVGLPAFGAELRHDDGLVLAPLDHRLPVHVVSLWRQAEPLTVPADDAERFLVDFAPGLQQVLPVVSGDGSVTVPQVVGPSLGLDVRYGGDDGVVLEWTLDYRIGETLRSLLAITPPPHSWRDPAAEAALLADPPLPSDSVPKLTTPAGAGRTLVLRQVLRRLDAARFVNEWLPELRDRVDVREHGTPPDLRLVDEAPLVSLATSDVAGERDWFDLEVQVTIAGEKVVLADLLIALTAGATHLFLESGTYFSLDRPELDQLRALLEEAAALQDRPGRPTLRISRFQAGLWEELVALGVVSRQSAAWEQSIGGLAGLREIPEPTLPASLEAELRPYQREGFRWLSFLWDHDLGGILADDMGLGKTVQTLALLARAAEHKDLDAPVLVVAPASVVHNWAAEAARFAPKLTVVTLTETRSRRGEDLADAIAGADLVVASYQLFRLEYDDYAALPWRALVLDESQAVKNPKSKAYQCARKLDARFKLAITGTPLENNLMDLWAQLSIVAPGLFPNPERFAEHFRRPIEKEQDAERLATLRRRIAPLMLRRTKELVAADLPPRQEQVLEVVLNDKHRRIYEKHLQRERQKVLGLVHDLDQNRFTILRSLTLLRRLSLHPALVDPSYSVVKSAKVEAILEQLADVVAEGHRVLVFSQFTSFLQIVRDELDAQGMQYAYLDGRTRSRDRVIERFRAGEVPVFLISLKAGGVGLNLTEADYVFVLDPWWNPAVEAQAVDRAHRIGQNRTVMVYRLVAVGTIEEKVMALKERKAKLFAQVLGGDALESAALTAEDIRALFGEPSS
jgi:superfamily II DNA or RNA helicase